MMKINNKEINISTGYNGVDICVYSSSSPVYQNKPKVISKFLHENKKNVLTLFYLNSPFGIPLSSKTSLM